VKKSDSEIIYTETPGSRIKRIRKERNLNQKEFGESIGISGNYLSDIENNKVSPAAPLLLAIEYRYSIMTDYILSGTEPREIVRKEPANYDILKSNDLLSAAHKVLTSGNKMASEALEKNIRYFAHAVEMEKRVENLEEKVKLVDKLQEKMKKLEEFIKAKDPCETGSGHCDAPGLLEYSKEKINL
jgi:transcriptional regulator with XRE-family HTH domain